MCERVPHVTLKAQKWEGWEIPREASGKWSEPAKKLHTGWWQQRIARQKEATIIPAA